tara:strand:- start:580 stop:933 length:354 start_codon:yes stop_codon:yes gene_type:complete
MIEEATSGSLAKNGKLNEVIRLINSLAETQIELLIVEDIEEARQVAQLNIGTSQSVMTMPVFNPEPELPETAAAGDLLYFNGLTWGSLSGSGGAVNPVLRHNGTAPYWDTPVGESCS